MLPNGFIQELLSRIDIVEVVGRHVELKRAGSVHKGLCPFHGEKTPSFTVSPSRQTYHCFGCGAHGDAIRFLTKNQGLPFMDAVRDLAQRVGVVIPEDDSSPQEQARAAEQRARRQTLTDVLVHAAEHYKASLKASPRAVDYRGRTLREFDLDAALARRPALVVLDELAHTNAPGSRHPKRWHDVEELLEAGIDVYTTVNVQHLESVHDIVAAVTGVTVRETVPDGVLETAADVELVDLPPDELLARLRAGKVYVPQQADQALRGFFRKGNLIALRELALRTLAERVDVQMRA